MKPACCIAEARARGIPVDENLKKRMKHQLTRLRNKSVGQINGQGNNWGGIAAVLESYKKENIFNFTQHSMYLIGINCKVKPAGEGKDIIKCVVSRMLFRISENALLFIMHFVLLYR